MIKKFSLFVIAGALLVGAGLASHGTDPASAGSTWSRTAGSVNTSTVHPGK